MKKSYLLFTILFAICTVNLFAQTADTASTKKSGLPIITDTTAILLKPFIFYIDTNHQVEDSSKTILKTRVIDKDSLKQEISAVTTDSTRIFEKLLEVKVNSQLQASLTANDSLQVSPVRMSTQMNVPPLISGALLKQQALQPAVNNTDSLNPQFTLVTDSNLQAAIITEITKNMDKASKLFVAVANDTIRGAIPQKMPAAINNLKQQIAQISNDSLRAVYYQKIADYYLRYDSITIRKTKQVYQEAAIEFTLKALHSYSRAINGYGIMNSYINLSKIYTDQKKYSQAKWFILQANTRARNLFDVPYTISTLISLANIKIAIKDYSLAKRDLDEALTLSVQNHLYKQEALVQQNFAFLYINLNQPKKADAALKRHDILEDSILKAADARRLAVIISQDSTIQTKKKLDTLSGKKVTKTNSYKRIASL